VIALALSAVAWDWDVAGAVFFVGSAVIVAVLAVPWR
jgi:hypothetical protein